MRVRSAYVHVPFCRHRCGYCNFTVIAKRDDLIDDYLQAIECELGWLNEPQPVDTVFFGGGTPTHLRPDQLARFFAIVKRWLPVNQGGEVSVEANPEDIDQDKLEVLANAGVDRVSLGVQSFRGIKLETLERSHDARDVAGCFEILRPAVRSLSLDLIFGAPQESLDQWHADLSSALALSPDHVSTYGLTYEPGTRFFARKLRNELSSLPEETEHAMYELAIDLLPANDFEHYEVSNFAKPGHRCLHNENYWKCGEYLGIGPGAASYVDGVRRSNHRSTTSYLKAVLQGKSPVTECEPLTAKDKAHEHLVFGLRRMEGIHRVTFFQATGFHVDELVGPKLRWLASEGLLQTDDENIRLTRKGLFVSDSIWPHLL